MTSLSRPIILFALAFCALMLGPSYVPQTLSRYPLLRHGDVLDLITPLILVPLYWVLLRKGRSVEPGRGEMILFLMLIGLWVEGQGLHLGANAIGHLVEENPASDVFRLSYFLDEHLSHVLWHTAMVCLSLLLVVVGWRRIAIVARPRMQTEGLAGVVYGFTHFAVTVEGQTTIIGVTGAVVILLLILVPGRNRVRVEPLLGFFGSAYFTALVLYGVWAAMHGWTLPEFSEVGLID